MSGTGAILSMEETSSPAYRYLSKHISGAFSDYIFVYLKYKEFMICINTLMRKVMLKLFDDILHAWNVTKLNL